VETAFKDLDAGIAKRWQHHGQWGVQAFGHSGGIHRDEQDEQDRKRSDKNSPGSGLSIPEILSIL
jgi:hypothetical protein